MSEVLARASKATCDSSGTYLVRCANCKREYVTSAYRGQIEKLKYCTVCSPRATHFLAERVKRLEEQVRRLGEEPCP